MTWIDQQNPTTIDAAIAKSKAKNDHIWQWSEPRAQGNDRYHLWLALADRWVHRMLGMSMWDLEDWHWADEFHDGTSPKEAAQEFTNYIG